MSINGLTLEAAQVGMFTNNPCPKNMKGPSFVNWSRGWSVMHYQNQNHNKHAKSTSNAESNLCNVHEGGKMQIFIWFICRFLMVNGHQVKANISTWHKGVLFMSSFFIRIFILVMIWWWYLKEYILLKTLFHICWNLRPSSSSRSFWLALMVWFSYIFLSSSCCKELNYLLVH